MDEIQPLTPEVQAAKAKIGFLLVGHGTRRPAGQAQLREVFMQFQKQLTPARCEFAFLELADPDIPTAVKQLAAHDIHRLITVPVLLFSAGHAQQDIPHAVNQACNEFGIAPLSQTEPLESASAIQKLSAERFREAVCDEDCIQADQCAGKYCSRTSLTMIGRGSSSDTATASMRAFTECRTTRTHVAKYQTAFIHAQQPSVQTALESMLADPQELKVVQPHLLFEGQLMDQLRETVQQQQQLDPNSRWIITQSLGTDAKLSKALADLAKSTAAAELKRLDSSALDRQERPPSKISEG